MNDRNAKKRKLNSSIDIIPIQTPSHEDGGNFAKSRQESQNSGSRDTALLNRVQQYLYDHEDQIYIDVNDMADFLQNKYKDYRGKKKSPFRLMVRRAYDEITATFSKKPNCNEIDEEIELQSDFEPGGISINNEIVKMYTRQNLTGESHNGSASDKELIDISSDDDNHDDDQATYEKQKVVKKSPSKAIIETATKANEDVKKAELTPIAIAFPEKPKKRARERIEEDAPTATLKRRRIPEPDTLKSIVSVVTGNTEKRPKFADVGGNSKVLINIARLLVHIKHPQIFKQLGITPTRGFLLHGPPGCGKSLLANAIAGELDIPLIKVAAPELIGGVSGESESRIRELFEQAVALAPCVLFIDEIDTLAPHRANAQREMERRIVAQLLSCLDDLNTKENGDKVLILGATNRPDSLDPALRRAGRFDREISLGIPDKEARKKILEVHSATLKLSPDIDLEKIAALSPGFVGADLVALLREAAIAAVHRAFKQLQDRLQPTEPPNPEIAETKPVEQAIEEEKQKEDEEIVETAKKDTTEPAAVDSTERNSIDEVVVESTGKESDEIEVVDSTDKNSTEVVGEKETVEEKEVVPTEEVAPTILKEPKLPQPSTNHTDVSVEQVEEKEEPLDGLQGLLKMLHGDVTLSPEELADLKMENEDFDVAFKVVQPSSKREGFATVPDVTWDDIGSLKEIREELQMAILAPVKHSREFEAFGLTTPTGVLLCGPPGCGKTLLAKAIANEAEINFISVKGPELLNMYVGESEKAVRQCFIRARNSAPCVIFFDELDALCPKRTDGDNSATSRVVNQMLTEMDGVEGRKGVYLMAATNRPDIIDPAVMRPGRFDKILYVGLPTAIDRADILKALTKNGTKPKFAEDVDLDTIAKSEKCEGYTGADLASLIREASIEALRESMAKSSGLTDVSLRHVDAAFLKIRPSVQEKDAKNYEKLKKMYTVQKQIIEDIAMETPVDTPMQDESPMEAMET